MTDVNQVIDLGSSADPGIMCYAPVDCAARTNFHIIFYHHSSATVHFFIPYFAVLFGVVVKSIRTDHRSCLDDHIDRR